MSEASGPSRLTLSRAINEGLRRALERDPKVLIMGEDVGKLGGVFRVTDGLQKDFGDTRVVDTPLAESGIVGTAIGLALRGYRPVCEIQFDGFVFPATNQIVNQLAKMRARSAGRLKLPVVIRIPCGGGIGAVEHHSESPEAYFAANEQRHPMIVAGRPVLERAGTYRHVRERALAILREGNEDPGAFRVSSPYRLIEIRHLTAPSTPS